jgi:hypothetical protein
MCTEVRGCTLAVTGAFCRRVTTWLMAVLTVAVSAPVSAQTTITGFVRDSLAARPLAGATIQLVPSATPWAAGRTVMSDSIGRYRIDSVPTGTYVIGFQHPRLDTLGMDAVSRTLDVPRLRFMRADLALPSGNTFVASLCGPSTDSAGAVIGRVFNASTNAPIGEGSVTVRWGQMQLAAGAVGRTMRQLTAKFGSDGRFVVCNLPTGSAVLLSARAGTGPASATLGVSSEIELAFAPGNPLIHRNLLIQIRDTTVAAPIAAVTPGADTTNGTATATATATTPAVAVPSSRPIARTGTARLTGRVAAGDGKSVGGARVHVVDTDQTVTTDSAGVFRLANLPAGTRALEITAIGFQPVRTGADLRPDRETTISVNVGPRIATLAAVDVVAPTDKSGFYKRRAQGLGYFLDGATVEQRGAFSVAQALATAPTLRQNGFDQRNPNRPLISGRSNCRPTAYLDGQLMQDGLSGIDDLMTVRRVGGIEVYANAAEAPPQFRASGNCAVIIVWSRAYVP